METGTSPGLLSRLPALTFQNDLPQVERVDDARVESPRSPQDSGIRRADLHDERDRPHSTARIESAFLVGPAAEVRRGTVLVAHVKEHRSRPARVAGSIEEHG